MRLAPVCISLLLSTPAFGNESRSAIQYSITLADAAAPRLVAAIECAGSATGTTTLARSGFARDPNPGSELTSFRATDSKGVVLECERLDSARVKVTHPPGELIRVEWDVTNALTGNADPPGGDYRTVVEAKRFHGMGGRVLMAPEHDREGPRPLRFEWRGFSEAGWDLACSHGLGTGPFDRTITLDEFRHTIFMAGDLDLEEREIPGGTLAVAVADPDEFDLEASDLADLAQRIVGFEREFMRDETGEFYLITMTPQGPRRGERGLTVGGTGLLNSFAVFVAPGMSLSRENGDFEQIAFLLTHEHFHEWNGLRIRRAQPEETAFWFSEGFTEFFTRRILFRSGIVSRAASVADFNKSIANYYGNPHRNAPNERVAREFFTDMTVSFVPYRRGDLAASILDHEIRRKSGGAQSLDDLMRDLLAAARERGEQVTSESLLAKFEEWTTPAVAAHLRAVVTDGADPIFPDDFGGGDLEFEWTEVSSLDAGFDVLATVLANEVRGVVDGGKAHAAGLRDGQHVIQLGYDSTKPDQPIPVQVEIDGEKKWLTIDPRGESIRIPKFVLRAGVAEHGALAFP
jgi:predicted metalloprotease with PDZ domain